MSAIEQAVPSEKWVGQAMRRKEDPRLITGRGRYIDDLSLTGHAVHGVRPLDRGARQGHLDRHVRRQGRARRARRLHARGPQARGAAADGVDAAGRRGQDPGDWPLAKGVVKYVGQPIAVVVGSDKYAVVDAAEQVVVEYDPLPVVVDPEAALENGAPLVHEEFGTNQSHEWSLGGDDMDTAWADADVVIERRIVNHRTAGAPIEPRVVHRRLPCRHADAAPHDPDPAPHPPLPGRRARDLRGQASGSIAPDVGGGFGVEAQASTARRSSPRSLPQARPAGQVDRDALRAHDDDDPRARPDRLREDRRQARRHDHRPRSPRSRRPRRLLPAADAVHPVLHGVRDQRLLQDPDAPDRHHRRLHQQVRRPTRSAAPAGPRRRT